MTSNRIGIFGGTFDPPHIGHLIIAEQAREQAKLDCVLFIPAFLPPHKRRRATAQASHRLNMARLAVRGNAKFVVSDMELIREGVSYTIDTVKEVRRRFPGAELFLIVGGDNLAEFPTWKSYQEILQLATLVVYLRSNRRVKRPSQFLNRKIHFVRGMFLDISSSDIRTLIRRNGSIRYLVPPDVERYIKSHKLYRRP